MKLTKQQILDAAPPLLKDFKSDIILEDDMFVVFSYRIINEKTDVSKLNFIEYGYCVGYQWIDEKQERIAMRYLSLCGFPPVPKIMDLRPSNIIAGNYITPDRLTEVWFKKFAGMFAIKDEFPECQDEMIKEDNCIPFRR